MQANSFYKCSVEIKVRLSYLVAGIFTLWAILPDFSGSAPWLRDWCYPKKGLALPSSWGATSMFLQYPILKRWWITWGLSAMHYSCNNVVYAGFLGLWGILDLWRSWSPRSTNFMWLISGENPEDKYLGKLLWLAALNVLPHTGTKRTKCCL